MNKAYAIFGSTEMGEKEVFAIYTDKAKANNMLSKLEGKSVGGEYDEFWIEEFELNKDIVVDWS